MQLDIFPRLQAKYIQVQGDKQGILTTKGNTTSPGTIQQYPLTVINREFL